MARTRTTKSLASRIELDYYKRRHPLRVWRARIAFLALVAPLLLLFGLAARGDDRVYSPGALSAFHETLTRRCDACHTPWGGIEDARCSRCHDTAEHHESRGARGESPAARDLPGSDPGSESFRPTCASCHREHGGLQSLAQSDSVGDAHCTQCHADLTTGDRQSLTIARQVVSFALHPEFAFQRDRRVDPGTIKLDHAKHLSLEIPTLGRRLDCADCHRPDLTGRRMEPITYARDCASCHALGLAGKLAGGSVTHGRPIAALEDDLRALAMARALDASSERDGDVRASLRDWVDGAMREAFDYLATTRCAECHEPEIPAPNIPRRWLPSADFDHASHATAACAVCHPGALTSSKSADVNLPNVAVCRTCHRTAGVARTECVLCHEYHPRAAPGR